MFILYYYIIVWEVMSTTICGVFKHVAQKYAKKRTRFGCVFAIVFKSANACGESAGVGTDRKAERSDQQQMIAVADAVFLKHFVLNEQNVLFGKAQKLGPG